ncbi:unnamed protein product [Discosporangium mesarthrocarpum]
MVTHPMDEGPLNKAGDILFKKMMEVTLQEDKDIIENIYPEYQMGFMNAKFDKQVLQYRKAMKNFKSITADRANEQVETSLQMELLQRISTTRRGQATTPADRAAILNLIQRLEDVQEEADLGTARRLSPSSPSDYGVSAVGGRGAPSLAAKGEQGGARQSQEKTMEGEWHLEYISNTEESWGYKGPDDPDTKRKVGQAWGVWGVQHVGHAAIMPTASHACPLPHPALPCPALRFTVLHGNTVIYVFQKYRFTF